MNLNPQELVLRIPAILLALTVHECAHGWIAYKFGDRTAYDAGRLTLNPFAHLDLIGTIMLFFGPFGWAKPVPVDDRYFKNPRKGILYVSLAGPLSNVALVLIFGYLLRAVSFNVHDGGIPAYFVQFLILSIQINAGLSFFNMLPVPPLDGSKILLSLLPNRLIPGYLKNSRYLPTIFIVLLMIEWGLHIPIFSKLIYPFFQPYFHLLQFLIFWKL